MRAESGARSRQAAASSIRALPRASGVILGAEKIDVREWLPTPCHCEERSDEAISRPAKPTHSRAGDCFVATLLAMTGILPGSPRESRSFARLVLLIRGVRFAARESLANAKQEVRFLERLA